MMVYLQLFGLARVTLVMRQFDDAPTTPRLMKP